MPRSPNPRASSPATRSWSGQPVLITGGLGFIGSSLVRRLVELGAQVRVIDCLLPDHGGNRFNLDGIAGHVETITADLGDAERTAAATADCAVVFNLAAQTSHLGSMQEPHKDLALNCAGQLTLLEALRHNSPQARIVYASTRQVYGRPDYLPVDERHPIRPPDINGIHKLAAEHYHLLYRQVYGLECSILRLTNVYGPRMRIRDAKQNFLGIWVRLLLEGRPFEVWEGTQRRDLAYVDDVVDAFLHAATAPAAEGGIFNIGGDAPVSLGDLARTLVEVNGGGHFEQRAFPAERKRIDIGDFHADDRAFRTATGWAPKVTIAEGLARTLGYYRAHFDRYL